MECVSSRPGPPASLSPGWTRSLSHTLTAACRHIQEHNIHHVTLPVWKPPYKSLVGLWRSRALLFHPKGWPHWTGLFPWMPLITSFSELPMGCCLFQKCLSSWACQEDHLQPMLFSLFTCSPEKASSLPHPGRTGPLLRKAEFLASSVSSGSDDKEPACQCRNARDTEFDPWVRDPWD